METTLARHDERIIALSGRVAIVDAAMLEGKYPTKIEHDRLAAEVAGLRESRSGNESEKGMVEKLWPLLLAVGSFIAAHILWK